MSDSHEIPGLMSIASAMAVLDVSRDTILRLVDRGELRRRNIGSAVRVAVADVDRLAREGTRRQLVEA